MHPRLPFEVSSIPQFFRAGKLKRNGGFKGVVALEKRCALIDVVPELWWRLTTGIRELAPQVSAKKPVMVPMQGLCPPVIVRKCPPNARSLPSRNSLRVPLKCR